MQISNAYLPNEVFAPAGQGDVPRVFIASQRYVQGKDVLAHMGRYLSLVRVRRAAILISAGGEARHGKVLADSLRAARIDSVVCIFGFVTPTVSCSHCGEPVAADDIVTHGGPGGRSGPGTRLVAKLLQERRRAAAR